MLPTNQTNHSTSHPKHFTVRNKYHNSFSSLGNVSPMYTRIRSSSPSHAHRSKLQPLEYIHHKKQSETISDFLLSHLHVSTTLENPYTKMFSQYAQENLEFNASQNAFWSSHQSQESCS